MHKTPRIKGLKISGLERAYDKMHAWFFAYPQDEFTLNDLCKQLEIAKTTANMVVASLKKEGFLEVRVLGKLWRIKANQEHVYFKTRKIPFNLKLAYESGILAWIQENIPRAKVIILFGSYRWGDDIPESDLDIAVEISEEKELEIIEGKIEKFGYRENVKASIHLFSRKHIDRNLFASMSNGIVLTGFLEVKA